MRPPATGLVDALRDRPWVTEAVEPVPGRIRLVVGDTARAEREIHLALAVAMLVAACGLTTNAASAILLTFGLLALVPIFGIVPSVKPWLPSELVAAIVFLLEGTPARDFGRSAAAATLATVALLALAGRLHERREL